jgi:hypothetical protein
LEAGVSETIRKPVEDLSCAAITVEPVNYDWSEGYGERWELVFPDVSDWTLQQCRAWLDDIGYDRPDPDPWTMDRAKLLAFLADSGIDDDFSGADEDTIRGAVISAVNSEDADGLDAWREFVQDRMQDQPDRYGPVMNYHYPLPEFKYSGLGEREAQAILEQHGGPVTLALVGGEPVLALTGGGMDLSPEICRAYMLLGYLPPVHFAGDLPRMGGRKSETDVWVAQGAVRACEVAVQWAQRSLERARGYLTWVQAEQGRS